MTARSPGVHGWRSVARLLWYVLTISIVLAAVGLTALRIAVAVAPEYRAQLEARIGDELGQPLTLGSFNVEWSWLDPVLVLEDVRVGGSRDAGTGLAVRKLGITLDLFGSLRARTPVLSDVELTGVDLTVQRDMSGRFRLVGVGILGQRDSALEAMETFLNQLTRRPLDLHLTDSRVHFLDLRRQHTRMLGNVELLLQQIPEGGQRFSGRAGLPEDWGRQVAFTLEWAKHGSVPLREDQVELFAEVRGLRSAAMVDLLGDAGGQGVPVNATGNLRLWGTLRGGLPSIGEGRQGNGQSGRFTVRLDSGELGLPELLRSPVPFDRLDTEVRWRLADDGWQVEVDEAVMANEDGRLMSRLILARRPGEPLFVDLRTSLHGEPGNAANTSRYLPAGVMHPKLVEWLDRGVVGGTATRADAIFFGHAVDFPFRDGSGHFEVRAEARDVTLRYLPDWPAITRLNGHLRIVGNSMHITADSGAIGGASLLEAEAVMPELGRTPLSITGAVEGPGDAMLGFLRDIPLTNHALDQILSGMRLDGNHGLSLALEIPFRHRPVSLDGTVTLKDGVLRVPAWGLDVNALNGQVAFDHWGVRASGLQARFHDAPLVLSAETRDATGGTRIRLRADASQVPMTALHRHVPGTEFLSGSSDLEITADLPGFTRVTPSANAAELTFRSDLVGVENSMPAPFRKAPGERVPLSVHFGVGEGVGPVRIRYGDHAAIQLVLDQDGVDRLGVRLGADEAPLPPARGMELSGRTPELDVNAWLAWSDARESVTSLRRRDAQEPVVLRWLEIEADILRLGGVSLPDVEVVGRRDEAWELVVDGLTVAGLLHVPVDERVDEPLRMNLQYLRLPALDVIGDDGTDQSRSGRVLTPADLPSIEADIRSLVLQERDLGRLRMRGARDAVGDYQLREFTLEGADYGLEASGRWRVPEGTNLRFSLQSQDWGALLSAWGYPDAVRGGRGRFHGNLAWSGDPRYPSPETVTGELQLNLRNGQLVQLEPGAGRLFGLLSVALLPRRLFLNFSDVFAEGFAFDRLVADFAVGGGRARPRTLYLDGPAARISAEGDVNLVTGTYDQTVTVAPKASAALPLIGGLLGGPPAAAALFLAQQLFSRGVDGVARVEYRVTGPWESPEIQRIER